MAEINLTKEKPINVNLSEETPISTTISTDSSIVTDISNETTINASVLTDEPVNISFASETTLNTSIKDLNYIPAYKEYEEERQANEMERETFFNQFKADVESGLYDGKDGVDGIDGADGKNTVYVGSEEPTDEFYNVWIDEDGTESTIPTKTSELTNDSGYITTVKTINNESVIGEGNLVIECESLTNSEIEELINNFV